MCAKLVRGIGMWLLSASVLLLSGCVSFVRTGQLFLTTRENCSFVSHRPCAEGMFNPLRFLALPFVAVGTVSFAPAYDLVCLPVDLTLKAFGTRVSVVGEDGQPIGGAEVTCMGDRLWESWLDEGLYNTGVRAPFLSRGWISVAKPGYYDSGIGFGGSVESCSGNDASHLTVMLQRVEHPIPLFVKKLSSRNHPYGGRVFDKANGVLEFDFLVGDWLPPVGKGEIADVRFVLMPQEDLGEGMNGAGVRGRVYRDSMSVLFLGKDNGLVEIKSPASAGLRIRTAPEEGFCDSYKCWDGVGRDLQPVSSYDKLRDFCFRIRTRRNDKGEIVEALYGKIYGDISFAPAFDPLENVASVCMLYYLNPTSLDRNLEWDVKTNLCPNPGNVPKEP